MLYIDFFVYKYCIFIDFHIGFVIDSVIDFDIDFFVMHDSECRCLRS